MCYRLYTCSPMHRNLVFSWYLAIINNTTMINFVHRIVILLEEYHQGQFNLHFMFEWVWIPFYIFENYVRNVCVVGGDRLLVNNFSCLCLLLFKNCLNKFINIIFYRVWILSHRQSFSILGCRESSFLIKVWDFFFKFYFLFIFYSDIG